MSGTWLDSENNFKYVPTFKNKTKFVGNRFYIVQENCVYLQL